MTKYDEQFKLKVVRQYLSKQSSFRTIGDEHGVDHTAVKRWVASYRSHGEVGLQRKGANYDAVFKLGVLERMRAEYWSQGRAAAEFDIRSAAHIGKWARQYDEGGINALMPRRGQRKSMTTERQPTDADDFNPDVDTRTIEQLRKENEYLLAENAYLKKLDALIQQKRAAAQKKRGS